MPDDWIDDLKSKDAGEGDEARRREEIQLHNARTIHAKAPEFWKALVEAVQSDCTRLQTKYPSDRPDRQARITQERAGYFVLEGKDLPIRAIALTLNLDGPFIRATRSIRDEFGQGQSTTEQISIGVQAGGSLVFKAEDGEFRTVPDLVKHLFAFVLNL